MGNSKFILRSGPIFALLALLAFKASGQVVITEFMADNKTTLADEDGAYSDWVELYNAGAAAVNLNGWYLTDNAGNLTKWRFPNTNIAAGAYMVVWASNKNRTNAGAPLHTSWALSADGEYLGLVMPNGTTIASQFAPGFPAQFADISYGVLNGTNVYFGTPTPGAPNSTNSIAFVADTKFNPDRGFYDAPTNVVITTATPGATIRYTTNGTPPSPTNGVIYGGPIAVGQTTVLRAAAFKTGFEPSNIDTHTYIFLDDVIQQSPTGAAPTDWPSSWGTNVVNYGMDPDVVNNPAYSGTIKGDLKAIPTVSLVMRLADLFDPATGIYANPGQKGIAWERPTSVEMIHPDGAEGFQVEAGIRIRGGFSRSGANPKHSFRLFFRAEYGDAKLNYPIYGEAGTDSFDSIDLQSAQNHTWHIHAFAGVGTNGLYLRDQFCRDTQLAMGHQAERGEYCHVYINGQYWGIYCLSERPEASYGASYFGGGKEDYDAVKATGAPDNTIEATDGDLVAWAQLWQMAVNGFASDADYQRVQGNNPDGSRNPAYDVLLDVPNLIDLMLIMFYSGSLDAPMTSAGNPYNFFSLRKRDGTKGFSFFVHDHEHTLLNVNENRTGLTTSSAFSRSNPYYFWQRLRANANFRVLFSDHVHRHFFNGGLLTPEACIERFKVRTNQLHRPLVAESARWGDTQRANPYTRNGDWILVVNKSLTNYFPQRSGIVLNQIKALGLYPNPVAPAFNQHGGNVTNGFAVSITAPAGTIYYTLDGSDPRLPGGAVSPLAQVYTAPVLLVENATVKARVWSGSEWSALNEAAFIIIQTFTELLVTEIMYHPPDVGLTDGNEFEFIELKNVSSMVLDLSGVHFSDGINFTFPNGTHIAPGEFVVLVSNPTAFSSKYPGVNIGGVYSGKLSNGGEELTLVHAAGATITSFDYSDSAPWPVTPDGGGFSLVPMNPNLNPDPGNALNWRASAAVGGSPGTDDPTPSIAPILVNEILTHTDPPMLDSIELFNPTASPVNVGDWFLTDERTSPFKFRIPANTFIPANGYVVFTETNFNSNPGSPTNFAFNSHGEEVYLYSADAAGNLTGYSHGFSFGAAANGVSFGRYVTSTGQSHYPAQLAVTLGGANAGSSVGPIVINEIRYKPLPGEAEFIELKNVSGLTVKMYDPLIPTNTWKVNGLGFTLPPGVEIPPGGLCVLTAADPLAFRAQHNVPAQVPVFGPWPGILQDNGEMLELLRPDTPDTIVPYIVVDAVRYNDRLPWPVAAANAGSSLERINSSAYGNDPINWRARSHGATPGLENNQNLAPFVDTGANQNIVASNFPVVISLDGTVLDDGFPPPGQLTVAWSQLNGPASVYLSQSNAPQTFASFSSAGTYVLRLTADDGEFQVGSDVTVQIERATVAVSYVPTGSFWKYLDDGSNQGSAWRAPGFNDSTWAGGPAKLGYGEGNEATVVNSGPVGNRIITTYFRHSFVIGDAENIATLTVRLLRDDGGVVYLNGTEIFRSNMPNGPINYLTLASVIVSPPEESAFFSTNVPPPLLVNGTNVLAVEIHQIHGTGTDMGFDLELSGSSFGTNQPPLVSAGPDFTIRLPADAALNGMAQDDGLPLVPGSLSVNWNKLSGPGAVSFVNSNAPVTTASFSSDGVYTLRLTADDGVSSAWGNVTVYVLPETYESWAAAHFNSNELANPNISGVNADPDGDGFTNDDEFDAGTDPLDGQSFLRVEQISVTGQPPNAGIRFNAAPRRAYSILYRDLVAGGTWLKLTDVAAGATARPVEIYDSFPGGSSRFYRIVTPPVP